MNTSVPDGLYRALAKHSADDVYQWAAAASEKERRTAFAYVSEKVKTAGRWLPRPEAGSLGLAVLACAPTAKRAATALGRLRGSWTHIPRESAAHILNARGVSWIGELAWLLAERAPQWGDDWYLPDALVQASGAPTPTGVAFVAGWIHHIRRAADPDTALRDSPYTSTMLPLLFEHDELGQDLAYTFEEIGFNPALVRLGHEDPDIRELLVKGCLSRLLRRGRPGELRPYVALYEHLAPPVAETTGYITDYIGLLSSGLTTAAALGQQALRRLHESGDLELETLIEASALILQRGEKGLKSIQERWLRQAAKRHPDRAQELLGLLQTPPPPQLEVVSFVPPSAPPMPAAVGSVAELAELLAALIAGDWSVATCERVLAGLTTLRTKDFPAFQSALAPVVQAHWDILSRLDAPLIGTLTAALSTTVSMHSQGGALHDLVNSLDTKLQHGDVLGKLSAAPAGLGRLMEHRLAEIATHANRSPIPFLMATPTALTGHIDPDVLVTRIEQAERDGWQPWRIDFAQALLRLPRDTEPSTIARALCLQSPAGKTLAARLQTGPADPIVTPVIQRAKPNNPAGYSRWLQGRRPDQRKVAVVRPVGEVDPIARDLFTLTPPEEPRGSMWWYDDRLSLGTSALPSHREVVAAQALPALAAQADIDSGRGKAAILPLLAECSGPTAVATALAVTYALTAKEMADRIAGIDALIAYGPALDATAVGAELAEACTARTLALARAVAALKHAVTSGAVAMAWDLCRGALPGLLTAGTIRPGTPDLLELATDCANTLGARGTFPELATTAQRTGSSRLTSAARRLHHTLQP